MRAHCTQLPRTSLVRGPGPLARADFFGVIMNAFESRPSSTAASGPSNGGGRDLRIDFFRGVALLFIFLDHIPNNTWANYTLKNFGFCDASEVFVFLSGYAAMLAYGRAGFSFEAIAARAYRRAATVYIWHIGVLFSSALLLYAAASVFANNDYVGNIALGRLGNDPAGGILGALSLTYQPNQMNILPLYVVLLLWFPLIAILLRASVYAAIAVSACIWAVANYWGLNFPVNHPGESWYFNPLTWQLLFTTGAAAAISSRPTSSWVRGFLIGVALAYLAFCVLYAAPWNLYSWAPDGRPMPYGSVGDISKGYLSIWRYLNILALALVVAELLPRAAAFLRQRWATVVIACGQKSLQIFALGTILSFVGWIVSTQLAASPVVEAAVNLSGLALLGWSAVWLTSRSERRRAPAQSALPLQITRA